MVFKPFKVSKMAMGSTFKFPPNPFATAATLSQVRGASCTLGKTGCICVVLGPVLSIRVHSPTEGVIGVKIEHFKAMDPTPNISLFPDDPPVPSASLSRTENAFAVSSGGVTAEVTQNPYTISFKSTTHTLTAAGYKHQAIYDVPYKWTLRSASSNSCLTTDLSSNPHQGSPPEFVRYVHSELSISPGELIYGLGEQFGPFVKNGKCISTCCMARFGILTNAALDFRPVSQHLEPGRRHIQRTSL